MMEVVTITTTKAAARENVNCYPLNRFLLSIHLSQIQIYQQKLLENEQKNNLHFPIIFIGKSGSEITESFII